MIRKRTSNSLYVSVLYFIPNFSIISNQFPSVGLLDKNLVVGITNPWRFSILLLSKNKSLDIHSKKEIFNEVLYSRGLSCLSLYYGKRHWFSPGGTGIFSQCIGLMSIQHRNKFENYCFRIGANQAS